MSGFKCHLPPVAYCVFKKVNYERKMSHIVVYIRTQSDRVIYRNAGSRKILSMPEAEWDQLDLEPCRWLNEDNLINKD